MLQLRPLTQRFADVRQAALIACIVSTLYLSVAGWNAVHRMAGQQWPWLAGTMAFVLLSATLPVFYFALYSERGILRFGPSLRLLSLAAAIAAAVSASQYLPAQIAHLSAGSSTKKMDFQQSLIRYAPTLLAWLSNYVCILSLLAFSLQSPPDESLNDISVSRLLRAATRAAAIVWGAWTAFVVARIMLGLFVFDEIRDEALQAGRAPLREFSSMLGGVLRELLTSAVVFAGPFIVWMSMRPEPQAQVGKPESQEGSGYEE